MRQIRLSSQDAIEEGDTETLREEGPPEVLKDNDPLIESIIGDRAGGGGCTASPATRRSAGWGFLGLAGLALSGLVVLGARRRRS